MYAISVIPLIPGIGANSLTYLSYTEFALGDVLLCPFRKGSIQAVVIDCSTVAESKDHLRHSSFQVKKISKDTAPTSRFSSSLMSTVQEYSHLYGLPYSDVFFLVYPAVLQENIIAIKQKCLANTNKTATQKTILATSQEVPVVIISDDSKKKVIIVPTVERAFALEQSIPNAIAFHGQKTKKRQELNLKKLIDSDEYTVILTPYYLSILEFIEPESAYIDLFGSEHYILKNKRALPLQKLASAYLRKSVQRLTTLDIVSETTPHIPEELSNRVVSVIDMNDSLEGTQYFWLSKTLLTKLKKTIESGGRSLLYVSRKGFSTSLVCQDCKKSHACESCGGNVSLHINSTRRTIVCPTCTTKIVLSEEDILACAHCGSWNMKDIGVGTERVYEELTLKGIPAFILDSDHTKTFSQTQKVVKEYENTPGAVVIMTDMSPSIFTKKIDTVAVVSLDSRLYIPHFSTDTHIVRTLLGLMSVTNSALLLQTRQYTNALMRELRSEGLSTLSKSLFTALKELQYPPFFPALEIYTKQPPKQEYFTLLEKNSVSVSSRVYGAYTVYFAKLSSTKNLAHLAERLPPDTKDHFCVIYS